MQPKHTAIIALLNAIIALAQHNLIAQAAFLLYFIFLAQISALAAVLNLCWAIQLLKAVCISVPQSILKHLKLSYFANITNRQC